MAHDRLFRSESIYMYSFRFRPLIPYNPQQPPAGPVAARALPNSTTFTFSPIDTVTPSCCHSSRSCQPLLASCTYKKPCHVRDVRDVHESSVIAAFLRLPPKPAFVTCFRTHSARCVITSHAFCNAGLHFHNDISMSSPPEPFLRTAFLALSFSPASEALRW